LLASISAAAAITTFSQTNTQPNSLDTQIRAEVANFKGKVYLFARNLETGETYSYNGDERVRTASTIKIAVMIEAWARVAEGKAKWID
jgi:beta-lactamase class A